ncbi:MAG: IS200/IS605 family transposase [Clostridia bacterium]|nr:IS200/IS605 family transposase [Clostridia bacterium]
MSEYKATRYATYSMNYHMVWIPKYRRKILTGDIAKWKIIALDIMPDLVHLFVSAPSKYSPAEIMKVLKGWSARRTFMMFPELAQKTGRGTPWAPSYYAGTAGNVSTDTLYWRYGRVRFKKLTTTAER